MSLVKCFQLDTAITALEEKLDKLIHERNKEQYEYLRSIMPADMTVMQFVSIMARCKGADTDTVLPRFQELTKMYGVKV